MSLLLALLLTASPGYVTKHEYHQVHAPMTMHRVHHIFDTKGDSVQASHTRQTRVYPGWKPTVHVYVRYARQDGHWRMVSKYAEAEVSAP